MIPVKIKIVYTILNDQMTKCYISSSKNFPLNGRFQINGQGHAKGFGTPINFDTPIRWIFCNVICNVICPIRPALEHEL